MTSRCMNFEFGKPFHNLTIEQCRIIGRRGGLRSARNRRLRRLAEASIPPTPVPEPCEETAHEAILLLDQRFPWLLGAELRAPRRRTA